MRKTSSNSSAKEVKYMYTEEKYQKDLAFLEKMNHLISQRIEFLAYFVAFSACLAVHIAYLLLFAATGITIMAIFNVFSVTFYFSTLLLVRRVKEKSVLLYATFIEIIIHATIATLCVGWESDFGMFLLMIIPIAFLMPDKNKKNSFIIMTVSILLYGILGFMSLSPDSSLYNFEKNSYHTIFYVINIFSDSSILIYFTAIYTIINRYTECKLRVQNEQLKILASTDPLTQLCNRREMNKKLAEVSLRCKENETSYIIGIGDIDNFKRVNDTYGHDLGDAVLSVVATLIKESLHDSGLAARWGGEEFLFVIPNADMDKGKMFADKIINSISKYKFTHNDSQFSVTMTFGLCEGQPDDSIDKIISRADSRLYKGKNNGKNRFEFTD